MPKCDGCTLCCYLFNIPELDKDSSTECYYCDGKGCTIYNNRPDYCKGFNCAYLQQRNPNIKLRPDKCGVVFEKINDQLFHGTMDERNPFSKTARGQIVSFNNQGYSVVIKLKDKEYYFLINDYTTLNANYDLNRFLRVKYGSSKLHN